jgi:hypothetical protein
VAIHSRYKYFCLLFITTAVAQIGEQKRISEFPMLSSSTERVDLAKKLGGSRRSIKTGLSSTRPPTFRTFLLPSTIVMFAIPRRALVILPAVVVEADLAITSRAASIVALALSFAVLACVKALATHAV